jgi:hypothetical protein
MRATGGRLRGRPFPIAQAVLAITPPQAWWETSRCRQNNPCCTGPMELQTIFRNYSLY